MKKILILCYFFPPNTQIGSWRPYSWAVNFHLYGLHPTIITRAWTGDEISRDHLIEEINTSVKIENKENFRLIKLPYKKNFLENICNYVGLKKTYLRINSLLGNLHSEFNGYRCFKKFIYTHLKNETYDIVLATQPPINLAKLAYKINKKFKIPYILDFRDLYNNHTLNPAYTFTLSQKISLSIAHFYLKRWLKKMSLLTVVSEPMIQKLKYKNQKNKNYAIIYNGYEKNLFKKIVQPERKNSKFTISILGSLYMEQDIDLMIKGFKDFIENKSLDTIYIEFIGTKLNKTGEKIQNSLPFPHVNITQRINRDISIKKICDSDVLFYIGWKGYKGIVSGKIFEYLGARKNILLAPSDEDILERIITETKSGKIANSAEELTAILNSWYDEWKNNGKLSYSGIEAKINFYTRELQAELLANEIKKII